jgi:hypothetical protein
MGKRRQPKSQTKVLSGQKPKKKRRIRLKLKPSFLAITLGISVALSAMYFVTLRANWTWLNGEQKTSQPPIHFEIKADVSPEQKQKILRILKHSYKLSRQELTKRVYKIQNLLAAKAISLIQTKPNHYSILMDFHSPKFAVKLHTTRLVNPNGRVYGKIQQGQQDLLPILRGIDIKTKPEILPDQTLHLEPNVQNTIDEALLLINQSLSYNITYKDIEFDPYRGFRGHLGNLRISVEFGRRPFDKKLHRLRKILNDLIKQGRRSARIELDYQGKAFVRELGS